MKINTYVSCLYGNEVMVSEGAFEEVLREMRCNHDSTLFRGQTTTKHATIFRAMAIHNLVIFLAFCASVIFAAPLRVTCIGDSITEGGVCVPESYTDLLQQQLGEGYEVLNAGVSGRTMLKNGLLDGTQPFSYWDTDTWQTALKSDPDIVTIMLGTNDAKYYNWEGIQQNTGDYFTLDYVDMINQLRANVKPTTQFFIMIPNPVFEPYPFDMNGTIINNIYPSLIPKIASALNHGASQSNPVRVIDLHTPLLGTDLTCDHCHPSHEANVVIADVIATTILTTMKATLQQ